MEEIVEVRKSRKAVDTATGAVDNDGRSSPPVSPTGQIIKTHKRARHFFFSSRSHWNWQKSIKVRHGLFHGGRKRSLSGYRTPAPQRGSSGRNKKKLSNDLCLLIIGCYDYLPLLSNNYRTQLVVWLSPVFFSKKKKKIFVFQKVKRPPVGGAFNDTPTPPVAHWLFPLLCGVQLHRSIALEVHYLEPFGPRIDLLQRWAAKRSGSCRVGGSVKLGDKLTEDFPVNNLTLSRLFLVKYTDLKVWRT